MNKQQAREIIKDTFENPFDKARYTNFIKNLLNRIEDAPFIHWGKYIPDAYKQYIKTLERIGKFSDGKSRIDILVITLKKETSLERARTMQRNFIAGYLQGKYGSTKEKDAALVAFVSPEEADWRFSLVKMDVSFKQRKDKSPKIVDEFTPARRWSFLVGVTEKSHTAQSQLEKILANDEQAPTLEEIEKAFDIEIVTKEFFKEYRDLFIRTKEELDKVIEKDAKVRDDFEAKGVDTVNFAKKLLGQIIFLYFLQKKGWFGVERDAYWGDGSKHFLRELFKKKHGNYNNFFNDILEPLFYEALRMDRSHDDNYYSRFDCKIPFLNGGLFDPIGNYDWVHTDIIIPDKLFSNNVKTKEGDTGDGILDIFDRYNFTVKEDEPLEKEVAIDPELLGKAYEKFNAIRPDNYDEFKTALKSGKKGEENKFNKKFGVYYTPREIVHYMCQQSLINYLHTELNEGPVSFQKIGDPQPEMFGNEFKKGQLDLTIEQKATPSISKEDIEILIHTGEQVSENEARVLRKGKETETYSHKLPESIRNNTELIDQKLADITVCDPAVGSGAFPVGMMSEIVKARNVLSTYIKDERRTSYEFKRRCIEHSLYGVDIDPGAVDIAKLRLWLSLVVDEDDIKNIKPLPNLDYRIVRGNSLIGFPENWNSQISKEIEELKHKFFNETNPKKKIELKKNIDDKLNYRYENSLKTFGYKIDFDFKMVFSEVFHNKGGFDIVIGNPPYLSYYGRFKVDMLKDEEIYFKKNYSFIKNPIIDPKVIKGRFHSIMFFIEKSLKISTQQGSISLIVDLNIHKKPFEDIRDYLFKNATIIEIVNDIVGFENVFSGQSILFFQNMTNKDYYVSFKDGNINNLRRQFLKSQLNSNFVPPSIVNDTIIQKIYSNRSGVLLDYFPKNLIRTGITFTGMKDRFLIIKDTKNKRALLEGKKSINSQYCKPKITNYINYDKNLLNQLNDDYANQLDQSKNKKQLWIGLGDTFVFESPKIIILQTGLKITATYSEDDLCLNLSLFSISNKNEKGDKSTIDLKLILGQLNSKIMTYFALKENYVQRRSGSVPQIRLKQLKQLPIIMPDKTVSDQLISIVGKILAITKNENYLQNPQKHAKVKALEKQIDQLVYKLYDLTPEEIKIVESSS